MTPDKQKSKSEYNMIAIYVRGDRRYINQLKARANTANMVFADYIREKLDKAIGCEELSFFTDNGNDVNQSGKA